MKISSKISCRQATKNKIYNKNLNKNALEYLAFGKDFILDRLTGSKS